MIGMQGLIGINVDPVPIALPGIITLQGELGCVGNFLGCVDLVCLRAVTYLTTINRISTIDYGAGVPVPFEVFRNRHVLRPVWEEKKYWFAYDYPLSTFPPVAYKWISLTGTGVAYDFPIVWNAARGTPTDRWYADPWAKPENWATYDDPALPPMTRSTVAADRYAADLSIVVQPGPLFFVARLEAGQSFEIETKVFLEDPFLIDSATPTLIDSIPTSLAPSASEAITVDSNSSTMTAWILRL